MAMIIACLILASVAGISQGNAFRGEGPARSLRVESSLKTDDLRSTMLDELMAALGSGSRVTEMRLQRIEDVLDPIFKSLPKNEHGHLDHAVARYALHRLFVLRHGMHVNGLEQGQHVGPSRSPTEVLSDQVPEFLQTAFEDRLSGRGLGMHELAILAATIEHVIHDQAVKGLQAAYRIQSMPTEGSLAQNEVEMVIDTYMILLLLNKDSARVKFSDIQHEWTDPSLIYPAWAKSKQFTQDVLKEVASRNFENPEFANGTFTFNAVAVVLEEVAERWGRFQDSECQDLKRELLKIGEPRTGRVPLKRFYDHALKGNWAFTESKAYLRELGALDETNPARENVIIANYVNSAPNCVASSSVFSVCCINECESLLGHLETVIAAPDATPEQITELVLKLPSSTTHVPRDIPAGLKSRLQEIASQHNGRIPLHGRLFSQWMHHAYPRECPYPHTTAMSRTRAPLTASADEMQFHAASLVNESVVAVNLDLMWTADEQLLAPVKSPRTHKGVSASTLLVVSCMAISLVAMGLQGSSKGMKKESLLPVSRKEHFC